MADKLTVYQKLTKIFGTGSEPQRSKSSFSVNDKELIKVRSPEEYNFEKLQSQQSKYLKNMWQMVDSEMYQQALYNETTRLASYADFESMEYFPEISAALDIMMEEATTLNEKGEVLNIYSDSKRVKVILEDLFFNRLDLYTNLPPWTRNTCKYGDNFVYLKVGDQKEGIIGVTQLPNIEMERRETDLADFIQSKHVTGSGVKYKKNLKFVWRGKNYEFNSWEVAHFRLLGDDRRLPYGTSVLEKTRRIWKQLLLAEDAMLVYRVSRAPERRIFKIFVGNMTDEDVEPYVQKIANKFKRNIITDPRTGQMDVRYNQLAVDQDFFIPVRSDSPGTIIDTLPGGSNLSEIADIEYLQNKLFAALRVPKPFLGFDATAGEGKNLALQDIRFARTVNRIQQSMIQELNKIAIIHLFLLGFEDELNNFELSLNNPSTQADMMKIEAWREKINLYRDAVADPGNGFQVTSMTWAKQHLLGMSNDEIKLDLEQQKIEKVAAQELAKIGGLKTGLFDHIDRIYKSSDEDAVKDDDAQKQEPGMGGGGGGGFGGGGLGGDLGGDLGGEGELGSEPGAEGELGGDTGVGVPGEGDTGTENPENDQDTNNVPEAIRSSNKPLITEDVKNLIDDIHIDFDKILKNKKS